LSSESDLLELEKEKKGLEAAEVDLEAPRAKRHRAAASMSHERDRSMRPSGIPGQLCRSGDARIKA